MKLSVKYVSTNSEFSSYFFPPCDHNSSTEALRIGSLILGNGKKIKYELFTRNIKSGMSIMVLKGPKYYFKGSFSAKISKYSYVLLEDSHKIYNVGSRF